MAAALAVGLIVSPALFAGQAPSGALSGEILGDQVAGAIVHAALDPATVRSSAPLGPDGKFSIEGLPEGVWNLAVQTDAGLRVASPAVAVHAGENRTVRISLAPGVNAQDAPVVATAPKRAGAMNFWNNPLTATLLVVGTAVVVGLALDAVTDDEPTPVSPSTN